MAVCRYRGRCHGHRAAQLGAARGGACHRPGCDQLGVILRGRHSRRRAARIRCASLMPPPPSLPPSNGERVFLQRQCRCVSRKVEAPQRRGPGVPEWQLGLRALWLGLDVGMASRKFPCYTPSILTEIYLYMSRLFLSRNARTGDTRTRAQLVLLEAGLAPRGPSCAR
jgi:hypothetical protein